MDRACALRPIFEGTSVLTYGPTYGTFAWLKEILFHPKALMSIRGFPKSVRRSVGKALLELQKGLVLSMPLSRPMTAVAAGVSELRIRDSSGAYRVFYYLRIQDRILVFHAFRKSAQKTPRKELDLGRKRLKELVYA